MSFCYKAVLCGEKKSSHIAQRAPENLINSKLWK